jgi:hypothetical protein
VINGGVSAKDKQYNAEIEVTLDGGKPQKIDMPASYRKRRLDIYWNFEMKQKPHRITLHWLNPKEGVKVIVTDAILFNKK